MLLGFFIFIGFGYLFVMVSFIYGWRKVPEVELKSSSAEKRFSVVIPFRNEAKNLPQLLHAIHRLKYPPSLFEILLVNDASEDNSKAICAEFAQNHTSLKISVLENLRTSNSPKKNAITTAIENSEFEYIITTDADCEVPEYWLQAFNENIRNSGAKLIAGPVALKNLASFLKIEEEKAELSAPVNKKISHFQKFEELDVLSLQGVGTGAFGMDKAFMCNGANLCYEKKTFVEMNGFSGNEEIASGDDVFLLQKFQERGQEVNFLKCKKAIVTTNPQESLSQLISQRVRWAAKTSAYQNNFAKFTGVTVLLINLCLVIGAFLALFNLFPYQPVLILFLLKFNLDFMLLYRSAVFFEKEMALRSYFWCSFIYPFFSTYIALKSLFSGFQWKGRRFKK